MFCRCLGTREELNCCCEPKNQIVYRVSDDGDGFRRHSARLQAKKRQTSLLTTIVGRMYEKCAGYNLRHCHFRGFVNNNNYLTNTLKDLFILSCFLLANFVVFMAIFTRMSVQITFCIMEMGKWLRRLIQQKTIVRPEISNIINPSRIAFINENSIIGLRKELNKLYEEH